MKRALIDSGTRGTYLIARPDRVPTYRHLLKSVWGANCAAHTHYVRVHMANLRKKLGGRAVAATARPVLRRPFCRSAIPFATWVAVGSLLNTRLMSYDIETEVISP